MNYLQLGQYALASLEMFKADGQPVDPFGAPEWTSSDPTILTCKNSDANPGYAEIRGVKLGSVRLNAKSGYDTGRGIKSWNDGLDIEVIDQEVATSEITLNYGAVLPLDEPAPAQKSKPK